MDKRIYALFEFYGTLAGEKNALCIRCGTPGEILRWLLDEGGLGETLEDGREMATALERPYYDRLEKLKGTARVTAETLRGIDLRIPYGCSCRAVCESAKEMPRFASAVREGLAKAGTGTVTDRGAAALFLKKLDAAALSEESYRALAAALPEKYL